MAGNNYIIKISDGADVLEELKELAKEKDMIYGVMVEAKGKIRDFELVSQSSKGSIDKTKSAGDFTISSISGKVEKKKDDSVNVSINLSVTKSGYVPRSGQLVSGKAAGPLEITVRKIDMKKIIVA